MADLEHIAREFEKVHDAVPKLETRLAVVEAWQHHHPETHLLESKALALAARATDLKMEMFDREHQRVVNQIDGLAKSRDTSSGAKSEWGKLLPWLLAAVSAAVAFFKK